MLALAAAGANLVLCAGLVAVLLAVSGKPDDGTAAPLPDSGSSPADIPADVSGTGTSTFESTDPPTSGMPAGIEAVSGPGGMTTVVPAGWPSVRASGPGAMQANDPADGTRFVRYGGSPAPAEDVYTVHVAYEQKRGSTLAGFQSLRLERITMHGFDAVDWEFEWDAPEGRRHVRSIYWRAQGYEYFVYASARVPDWPEMRQILITMIDNASP